MDFRRKRLYRELGDRVSMRDLFGFASVMDVLNSEFRPDETGFPAVPACWRVLQQQGGKLNKKGIKCLSEIVALKEREAFLLCQQRSDPTRCLDEWQALEQKVVTEVANQAKRHPLSEEELRAKRHCNLFDVKQIEGE